VRIGGTSVGKSISFVKYTSGTPILFWRQISGEDISWSSTENGELFRHFQRVSNTSDVTSWSVVQGRDGHIKLLFCDGKSRRTMYAVRDALSQHSAPVSIFKLPVDHHAIKEWIIDRHGTLFINHTGRSSTEYSGSGVYAVRDISLGGIAPPTVVMDARIDAVFPQPLQSGTVLNVLIHARDGQCEGVLILSDILGRNQYQHHVHVRPGINRYNLATPPLSTGMYMLSFLSPIFRESATIIISK